MTGDVKSNYKFRLKYSVFERKKVGLVLLKLYLLFNIETRGRETVASWDCILLVCHLCCDPASKSSQMVANK